MTAPSVPASAGGAIAAAKASATSASGSGAASRGVSGVLVSWRGGLTSKAQPGGVRSTHPSTIRRGGMREYVVVTSTTGKYRA